MHKHTLKYQLTALQKYLPQHLLTELAGKIAAIRRTRIKNALINWFIKKYHVDMSLAVLEKSEDYPDFNHFFIRKLKPELRPIVSGEKQIACPVDGTIAQIGKIQRNQILQAKQFYYDLETLVGGDTALAQSFYDGQCAAFYLAPRDYHRIHMPLSGNLIQSTYIPGKLFSVNRLTSEIVPGLYSRNERLVTLFDTSAGKMAVILVGAMIVGSIQTVWMDKPVRSSKLSTLMPSHPVHLTKGAELGYFKLGSTVIVLFEKNNVDWLQSSLQAQTVVKFGQLLGTVSEF